MDHDDAPARELPPRSETTGTPPPLDERDRGPMPSDTEVREWTYDPSRSRKNPVTFPKRR